MNQIINYKIVENKKLNHDTYELCLLGPSDWVKPGQFIEIEIPNKFLRRPMSICRVEKNKLYLVYKVVGEGTEILANLKKGFELNVLINLGNNFKIKKNKKSLILAGGCGIGSVFMVAQQMTKLKQDFTLVFGFKTKQDIFYVDELKKIVKNLIVCTDDGSYGFKGTMIEAIKKNNLQDNYYYACGSTNCLKAIFSNCKNGQLSLEARMGCGYGVCMGCSIKTKKGFQRVCKEGPIFESKDLLW